MAPAIFLAHRLQRLNYQDIARRHRPNTNEVARLPEGPGPAADWRLPHCRRGAGEGQALVRTRL